LAGKVEQGYIELVPFPVQEDLGCCIAFGRKQRPKRFPQLNHFKQRRVGQKLRCARFGRGVSGITQVIAIHQHAGESSCGNTCPVLALRNLVEHNMIGVVEGVDPVEPPSTRESVQRIFGIFHGGKGVAGYPA